MPLTLIVVGGLQGLAMTAVAYVALDWLLHESVAAISPADLIGGALQSTFEHSFESVLWLLMEQASTVGQVLLFTSVGFIAARSLAKLVVARRSVDLVRGGSSLFPAMRDVLLAWPLYAVSFAVTRLMVFVGFLAFGLPGLALLLVFAVFAPMFAVAGPRIGALLASLDFLNGPRMVGLLVAYVVFFIATLLLTILGGVASVPLGFYLNAELIETLGATDFDSSMLWLFSADTTGVFDIDLQKTALNLALSGAPLWFAFGISDALLTLVAATSFAHYQKSSESSKDSGASVSEESRPGSAVRGAGDLRMGRGPSPGSGFFSGGSSNAGSDDSPWS